MHIIETSRAVSRDHWMIACSASALIALLMIAGHVASPLAPGLDLSHAGGAAVVLGIGAVLGSGVRSQAYRLLVTSIVLGLMVIRLAGGLRPDLFITSHGRLSLVDGGALAVLIMLAASLLVVAARSPVAGDDAPRQPLGSGAG